MIDQCNAIFVLRGSEKSTGVKKELEYVKSKGWSKEAGKIIYEEEVTSLDKYFGESENTWVWGNPYQWHLSPYLSSGWGFHW